MRCFTHQTARAADTIGVAASPPQQVSFTMGQRHQVYFRLPADKFLKLPERTIGFHVQFSYGTLPIRNILRVFDYLSKHADGDGNDREWSMPCSFEADLRYVQSFDAASGQVSRYYPLCKLNSCFGEDVEANKQVTDYGVCVDPRLGDNNDGITVIDMVPVSKGKAPTYAMLALTADGWSAADQNGALVPGHPYTAASYLNYYYPAGSERAPHDTDALALRIASYKTMSAARLRAIFPAWLGDAKARKAKGGVK